MKSSSWETPARTYAPGIGDAVADRTINRPKADGTIEKWEDVALRVAIGNTALAAASDQLFEFEPLHRHLRQASILLSGRHLQHGDATQPTRNQEVFTNCSTSASSFILFYLLLNGSGVGRAYDNDMMVADWSKNMPYVVPVIRDDHGDVLSGEIGGDFVNPQDTDTAGKTFVFEVPDSREGWAKAVEQIEFMTWTGNHRHDTLILEFSGVRKRGSPIGGMQNRPASGPGPLMTAIKSVAAIKGTGMAPWKATMYVDHALAECVLVGGARRAARMATKTWRDMNVGEFVSVKKGGVLWSSNNSVTVDEQFWNAVKAIEEDSARTGLTPEQMHREGLCNDMDVHAFRVFEAICEASYHDGTGEPGLINVERLTQDNTGVEALFDGDYAESERFQLDQRTKDMTAAIAQVFAKKEFTQITNPCGEISLAMVGAYCVIADVVPYHSGTNLAEPSNCAELAARDEAWDADAEDAFRTATRALIRVNTMDCLYRKEVARTNRIGVGFTGLHEYAWARFGIGWKDMVNEEKSIDFWRMMGRFSNACVDEAGSYSKKLGLNMPHTVTTVKPAGTTSKLFGLTEGAHLPSMKEYLRWVQFRNGDPLIAQYAAKGYPVRELVSYSGTTIVGFPTVPEIVKLGMGDALVTAADATPEEQYEYLRLLEKWWIDGHQELVANDGMDVGSRHTFGNQVSYTLKYRPTVTSYEEFRRTLLDGQSTVKCCSVMPQTDSSAYEYQPEQPVTPEEFQALLAGIKDETMKQDIGFEHVDCGAGGCPIDWGTEKVA